MAKKMSNATKLKISNALHERLAQKAVRDLQDAKSVSAKKRALTKKEYHQDVITYQNHCGRVVSDYSRQYIWKECKGYVNAHYQK